MKIFNDPNTERELTENERKEASIILIKIYESLKKKREINLFLEAWYLRVLLREELSGDDLLFFCPSWSRNQLIKENLPQYLSELQKVQSDFQMKGFVTPSSILKERIPTCEEWIRLQEYERVLSKGMVWEHPHFENYTISYFYPTNDQIEKKESGNSSDVEAKKWLHSVEVSRWNPHGLRPTTPRDVLEVSDFFGPHRFFKNGQFIDRLVDVLHFVKAGKSRIRSEYRVFTQLSPQQYKEKILDYGFYLKSMNGLIKVSNIRKEYEKHHFLDEIESVVYTGKSRKIWSEQLEYTNFFYKKNCPITFYEAIVVCNRFPMGENPEGYYKIFKDSGYAIAREAEDNLRVIHRLPKIGEGWYQEMLMIRLIENCFTHAKRHARLSWLKRQHFDCYLPEYKIAFEFQGAQHYRPIDYFGGKSAFEKQISRDKTKKKLAEAHHVQLIEWKYDETISFEILKEKILNCRLKKKIKDELVRKIESAISSTF